MPRPAAKYRYACCDIAKTTLSVTDRKSNERQDEIYNACNRKGEGLGILHASRDYSTPFGVTIVKTDHIQ